MATVAAKLESQVTTRPAEWDVLMPSEGERVPWQVWTRRKGAGYWLMRWATKLCAAVVRVERIFGRDVPDAPSNPNGLEEPATFWTEEEAKDLCRIIYQRFGGRMAVTYGPLVVGRVHPFEYVKAVGDRPFDPFKAFDFSATDAVKEQARHVLVPVDDVRDLHGYLARMAEAFRLLKETSHGGSGRP
jgi:hypothetical protein